LIRQQSQLNPQNLKDFQNKKINQVSRNAELFNSNKDAQEENKISSEKNV